jgi:hypothetical protein
MAAAKGTLVFDYRALRLLMGVIAFALPFIVTFISTTQLSSISASYYTEARNLFVGLLFFVSAFLFAYNGHSIVESVVSKLASVSAIMVALFPTNCDTCAANANSVVHYSFAVALFAILAYFCFIPFRSKLKGKAGKRGRRNTIYLICGYIIVASMLAAGISKIAAPESTKGPVFLLYWAEAISLWAFGVAWITAGKVIPPLVDEKEQLKPREILKSGAQARASAQKAE